MYPEIYYGCGEQYRDITGCALVHWYDSKKKVLNIPSSDGARIRMLGVRETIPQGINHIKLVSGIKLIPYNTSAKIRLDIPITIWYGNKDTYVDVTAQALDKWVVQEGDKQILQVPKGDYQRCADLGGDPLFGVLKFIKVLKKEQPRLIQPDEQISIAMSIDFTSVGEKVLTYLHQTLRLIGGGMHDEYPEQLMVAKYLRSDATVLELGSNIGRNTLVISSILDDSHRLVTVECDPETCKTLKINRDVNLFNFHICNAALSIRRIAQKGWDTISLAAEEPLPAEHTLVQTITYQEICKRYGLTFDTLVADVEGALYWILQDMPEVLDYIHTVIVENDYRDINHKLAVDEILTKRGFKVVYQEEGGWGPCWDRFYEVWTTRQG